MALAIIAEYNPFHNGHIYQLEHAKKLFPNDDITVILSGRYVQRGEIAVASFEERKAWALKYGAKSVVELPFACATQAAHIFAQGAMKIVNDLHIDKLLFGSETNDVARFYKIATFLKTNREAYNHELKTKLKQGMSFPKANNEVLKELLQETNDLPNDILGLEYVKTIYENQYPIQVYTLKRTTSFHGSTPNEQFASASLLRKLIFANDDSYKKYTPMRFTRLPERIEDHYGEFQQIVRTLSVSELAKIKLVTEGLERRFKDNIDLETYDLFVNKVNSRRHTSSRIKRTMLYVLLRIEK